MSAGIERWLADPLPEEVRLALERLATTPDLQHLAVMPDVHLARDVCIGVVAATRSTLFPEAVGGDIGCGISAMRFSGDARSLADSRTAARVFDGLYRRVPQNRHPVTPGDRRWPDGLSPDGLGHSALQKLGQREGFAQLGSLGRGNHFLEFQTDDDGSLWVMVHQSSVALGRL